MKHIKQPDEILEELNGVKDGTVKPEQVMGSISELIEQSFLRGTKSSNSLIGEFYMGEDYYQFNSTAPGKRAEPEILYFSNDLSSIN